MTTNNKIKENKMDMTEYEKSILNLIGTDEMNQNNGSLPRTVEESATWVFTDQLADDSGLTVNQVKGVLSSLVKKGLINIDDYDADEESLVNITKKGIDMLWDG